MAARERGHFEAAYRAALAAREEPTHFEWPECYEVGELQTTACGKPLGEPGSHTSYRKEVTCVACLQTMLAAREVEELPGDGQRGIRVEAVAADQLKAGDMVLAGDRPHILVDDANAHYQGANPPTVWLADFRDPTIVDRWGQIWRVVRAREAERHAEVLAKALDEFLRDDHVLWGSPTRELRDAVEPTLQALGYPRRGE